MNSRIHKILRSIKYFLHRFKYNLNICILRILNFILDFFQSLKFYELKGGKVTVTLIYPNITYLVDVLK